MYKLTVSTLYKGDIELSFTDFEKFVKLVGHQIGLFHGYINEEDSAYYCNIVSRDYSKRFQETIQKLQIALVSRGFDVGEVNGLLHSRTIAAVYEYQSKNNFIPNGKITPETLSSLGITA